ncbi:MAG TPA: hypothetical protein VK729_10390, partial [Silvibacterium sp.]|nr:hypothetical protein [Silvibacterium sp.]
INHIGKNSHIIRRLFQVGNLSSAVRSAPPLRGHETASAPPKSVLVETDLAAGPGVATRDAL